MKSPQAAAFLGISPFYLRNMRHELHTHNGPRYTQCHDSGGRVYYDYAEADLKAWALTHSWRKDKDLTLFQRNVTV